MIKIENNKKINILNKGYFVPSRTVVLSKDIVKAKKLEMGTGKDEKILFSNDEIESIKDQYPNKHPSWQI